MHLTYRLPEKLLLKIHVGYILMRENQGEVCHRACSLLIGPACAPW